MSKLPYVGIVLQKKISVISAVSFHMLLVRQWIEQPKYVHPSPADQIGKQHGVGGASIAQKFEFRIIDDDVAVIADTEFRRRLAVTIFIPFASAFIVSLPHQRSSLGDT